MLEYRAAGGRQYEKAREANLHPTLVSSLLNDIVPLRENDPRVLALGKALGVPDAECFEPMGGKGRE
jgi:hypothetical protein